MEVEAARLKTIPLFANLGGGELPRSPSFSTSSASRPARQVVTQGERGDKLYLVNHGQLEVVVGDERGDRPVNTLYDGDYFGETGAPGRRAARGHGARDDAERPVQPRTAGVRIVGLA